MFESSFFVFSDEKEKRLGQLESLLNEEKSVVAKNLESMVHLQASFILNMDSIGKFF